MNQISAYIKDQIKPWWDALDKTARMTYMLITAAALIALVISSVIMLRPQYETLYNGLDPAEAGQVVERLKEGKVPYRLENGGTTIEVARKSIYDVRLQMASEGLPRSGTVGYEIFDKANLGMTDFLQKVNYRRALEGELSKSIASIREVKSARVHLVIPEPRLFKEDNKEATASVILTLAGARTISSRQVEGISYLVASSVEGLNPDNVTILDSNGRLLSEKKYGDQIGSLSSSQLDLRKNVETYLETKARSMLDPVIGMGKSVVTVAADLNFEQVEKNIESYDPDNTVVRSEEKNTEKSSESNTKTDGLGKTINNSKENTVTNYEVTKTLQHVVSQIGNIQRLWVAVVVDGVYKPPAGGDGKAEKQYNPRSQEDIDKITGIVKSAVGFVSERNDIIEVANVPFENNQEVEVTEGFFSQERIDNWIAVAIKLMIFGIVVMIFLKARKSYSAYAKRQKAESQRKHALEESLRQQQELMPKLKNEPQLVDHIRAIADEKPAEVAKVIRTMMVEA